MEQSANAPPPDGSFSALLRAFRHRAYLSQEQLAARAELSERTVRNIEAGRVLSPRIDTVRLLADALALTEPERESWFAASQCANARQAAAGLPGAGDPAQLPGRVTVAVLIGDAQHAAPAITWLIGGAGQTVLIVCCARRDVAPYPPARLTPPAAQPARSFAVVKTLAVAENDGVDHDPQLIDESCLQKADRQAGATEDGCRCRAAAPAR